MGRIWWYSLAVFCSLVLFLTGCASSIRELQDYPTAQDMVLAPIAKDFDAAQEQWWKPFADETLQGLIEQGLAENLSLRSAWHRLEQSGFAMRSARSARFPQLTVQGAAGQQRQLLRDREVESGNIWSASAALSYELDVWQRIAASVSGATYAFDASAMDYEAMAISIVAAITDAWLDVQEQTASVALLEAQLEAARRALRAVERRFQEGIGELLDVYQQRELVAGLESMLPHAKVSQELSKERLAVLLGVLPGNLVIEPDGALPDPVALPADITWQDHVGGRPDVRAAWLRLQAAQQDALSAARERLPLLQVQAQGRTQEEDAEDLFEEFSADALIQIHFPLFDGGRLRAEARRVEAIADERLHAYREIELQALQEIREGLLQDAAQKETISRLTDELSAARRTLELSRERYRNGLVEYLNVLSAQQRVQQLERGLLRARRDRLRYQLQFARATAGGRD